MNNIIKESFGDPLLDMYFKDISNYPVMTKDKEAELMKAYDPGVDKKTLENARSELIVGNLSLVISCVRKFYERNNRTSFSYLIEIGNEALVRASYNFKNDKGVTFSSFAYACIEKSLYDYYGETRLIHVPKYFDRMRKDIEILKNNYGDDISNEFITEKLAISSRMINCIKQSDKILNPQSLDELFGDGNIFNIKEPADYTMVKNLSKEDLKRVLNSGLDKLSEKNRLVMHLYFYEELTFQEIADRMGICKQRAYQRFLYGMKHLKRVFYDKKKLV